MNILQRFQHAIRAFVLGPVVVDEWDTGWGKSGDDWQPAEYADYLATSNAVYTCANLRADLLASLPLRLYNIQGGDYTEVTSGPLYDLIHTPNPHWSLSRLIKMTELSLCLWGESFWFLERGTSGRQPPKEIWWGRADSVKIRPDPKEYIAGFTYTSGRFGEELPFTPGEVVWFRFPNPADEYEGLSPLAAARLAADSASAAMKGNKNIFDNGMQPGGFLMPKAGVTFTDDQAKTLEHQIDARFKGIDKRHRFGIFRTEMQIETPQLTPKDAEFLGLLNFSLEEVARAYRIPLDVLGGQRTYANVEGSRKAIWTDCIIPEAQFIADEMTRQLAPIFGVDVIEFDATGVEVLQENRTELVQMMTALYNMDVPLNALLDEFMPQLKPSAEGFEWGNEPKSAKAPPPMMLPPGAPPEEEEPAEEPRMMQRAIAFGSVEHVQAWRGFVRATDAQVGAVVNVVTSLFERQRDSILDKLKAGGVPDVDDLGRLFDQAKWTKEFRVAIRPILTAILVAAAKEALENLGSDKTIDVKDPAVIRFLEARAQRFAVEVNDTTWQQLKDALSEGITGGEGIPELSERVRQVMGDRIRSSAETIARTETIGAYNGGTLEAWKESGVVKGKVWLAALDERTRETHVEAHGQEVALEDDFDVGDGHGPAPGEIGLAEEDINCRCTMSAILDIDWDKEETQEEAATPQFTRTPQTINVNLPQQTFNLSVPREAQPAPVVNVTVPEQKPPDVKVDVKVPAQKRQDAPVVNVTVPTPVVNVTNEMQPAQVTVNVPEAAVQVQMPPATTTVEVVERDDFGRVSKIVRTTDNGE